MSIGPMGWFVKRRIWYSERMPREEEAFTMESLSNQASNYSPIHNSLQKVSIAVKTLVDMGLAEISSENYVRLTRRGLTAPGRGNNPPEYNIETPVYMEIVSEVIPVLHKLNKELKKISDDLEKSL